MTEYWTRWISANGEQGAPAGPFDSRAAAEIHIREELRRFAADLEHGTGVPGVWAGTALYRGDYPDDVPLGHFVIEITQGD